MSSMTLVQTNGSKPHPSPMPVDPWLQLTTQKFFSAFNWDDNPPEVQEIKQTSVEGTSAEISLSMKVSQFFAAVNWDGSAIATPASPAAEPIADLGVDAFTLEDFSDLF